MASSQLTNTSLLLENTGSEIYYRSVIDAAGFAQFGDLSECGSVYISSGDSDASAEFNVEGGSMIRISAGEDHCSMYLRDSTSGRWIIGTTSTGDLTFYHYS